MRFLVKTALATMIASISFSPSVMANVIPDAGQLLQQQQPVLPYQPQQAVDIESTTLTRSTLDEQQKISVQQIQIVNQQSFSSETLHALAQDAEGQSLSLAQLQQLADRITQYYQQQGYPYSRAYLPAQTLTDGHVTIAVIEAKYDQIIIDNQTHVRPFLVKPSQSDVQSGSHIEALSLQQQIKILNRLNGVQTRSVISAGTQPGTSQLNLSLTESKRFSGYIGADNYGNEYTKEGRISAGASLNNPLGLGDQLNLDAMTSGNLHYGRLSYEAGVNAVGSRLGVSYSDLEYKLGKEYKALDANGRAQQSSVWLNHPILLNNQSEVVLTFQYDHKALKDDIELSQLYRHRNIDVGSIRLDAMQYDDFAGGGLNQLGLVTSIGRVNFKNAVAEQIDQLTAQTQGEFYSASLNLSRLQNLGSQGTQLYGVIQGQYSPYNLDSAEQFNAGGVYRVAGYQNNVLSGSSGYYALGELRQKLWSTSSNQLEGKVYVDTARVKFNADRWVGLSGGDATQIHSAGLGLNWNHVNQWQAQARIGFPFGDQPKVVDERNDVEAWISLYKRF